MPVEPLISVCIVTGRRNGMLDEALRCLQDQLDSPTFEVLVCADADPTVEATVRARFPDATVVHVPKTLPSAGRNHLLGIARGELLYFLDDDILFGPRLLARLAELAEAHPDCGVYGGPNDTPRRSSRFQRVQGAVLASLVASGPVRRRYGRHPEGRADERWFILCNLAVRRTVMRRFDEELVCAEENALLSELHAVGVTMHYDPELSVFHERRSDLRGFVQQMHKYGRGRGQVIRRDGIHTHPAFLLPAGLVAYLAVAPLLWLLVGPIALVPAGGYVAVVLGGAAKVASSMKRATDAPLAALLIVVVHGCYGTGVIRGLLRKPRRRTPRRTAPAELSSR